MIEIYVDILAENKQGKWDGTATPEEMEATMLEIKVRFGWDLRELDDIDVFCAEFGYNWLDYLTL